jgi:acyl carrier protein
MNHTEDLKKEIFTYVKDNTFKETGTLTFDTKLFMEGIFDSMGFVLLLDYLEEKHGVTADDEDLVEENFESINAIADFILRKKSSVV